MTTTFFMTSETAGSTIWTGGNGDGVYLASGVALTEEGNPPALYDQGGNVTAQINGSVTANGYAIAFGNGSGGTGTATIEVGSTGSLVSTIVGEAVIDIDQDLVNGPEVFQIANAGLIEGAGEGIFSLAPGTITNSGAIYASTIGVLSSDSVSTDTVSLYNYGTISAQDGVVDTGGHTADIYNSGAIDGGAGDAIFSDAATTEALTNYATGTISGGVDLNGIATVTNEGTISGGATLAGVATLTNSGTMDQVSFTNAGAGSSFSNSGLLTRGLNVACASFTADNSGTIDGSVSITGDSASLTDSGIIKQGVALAGGASGTSVVHITHTGVVTGGGNGLQINAGAYDVFNAGEIESSFTGVDLNGGGQLVNRGKIVSASGGAGVFNDAGAGATAYLYNYGSIDALGQALSDTGGHTAVVDNYGTLTGGSGYWGVLTNSATVERLLNAGTIVGGVDLNAPGSTVDNRGTSDGPIYLLGGGDRFTNEGVVNGDIVFGGTDNVYSGTTGSVTGTIYGSGADGVYYGGNDGETFDMTASGAKLIVGGTGSDTFFFTAAGLTNATTLQGGGGTGTNTLDFTTAGTITASQLHHVSGIEQIDLANGTNSITLSNALIASANGASLTVSCASGADTINASGLASSDHLTVDAGQGVDDIKAGGTDTFYYASGGYSSGPGYDTIAGANYALDKFDLNGAAVTTIDAAVTVGSLSTATFNASLSAAIGASHLLAHSAVLFTPNAGTLAGHTFLIADTVGLAGYQAGKDLVVDVTGAKGTLAMGNFV